jgi:hypothetical protein
MKLWVSTKKFTGEILTSHGIVYDAPPVWCSFQGQPVENLLQWLKRVSGPVEVETL